MGWPTRWRHRRIETCAFLCSTAMPSMREIENRSSTLHLHLGRRATGIRGVVIVILLISPCGKNWILWLFWTCAEVVTISVFYCTPSFLPSHSVILFCLLPNHYFSNLGLSDLGQPTFLKFNFFFSKWPKFYNKCKILWRLNEDQVNLCVILWLSEWGWPQASDLNSLACPTVVCQSRFSYHTSFDRRDSGLTYEPKNSTSY